MSIIKDFINRIRRKPAPPVIMTEFGPVSESARLMAAENIGRDPDVKSRVIAAIAAKHYRGNLELAEIHAKRVYPEGFTKEDR